MNCPQCGREMQSGYVSAGGYPVIWTTKEHKMASLPGRDGVLITKFSLAGKGTPAYLCRVCQTVVIKY